MAPGNERSACRSQASLPPELRTFYCQALSFLSRSFWPEDKVPPVNRTKPGLKSQGAGLGLRATIRICSSVGLHQLKGNGGKQTR